MIARIHSCETMGTVDGPGNRFVIFFQGCPMKCLYCHNRDTWSCEGGKEVSLDSLIQQISSLKGFYKPAMGGVTVTGGEPLLQSDFVLELFKKVHDLGLTTAVDTSGCVKLTPSVQAVLDETDYLLLDVKSVDETIHKKLTGRSRELPLAFASFADENLSKGEIWIRYVLVPGYTDGKENRKGLSDYIKGFQRVKRVDILPYHSMGVEKWSSLGYEYPLKETEPPLKEDLESFKNAIAETTGLIVK